MLVKRYELDNTKVYLTFTLDCQSFTHKLEFIFKPGARRLQVGAPVFLKLILCGLSVCVFVCVCVCVCVCLRPRLLITSGVIWHDMNLI